MQAKIVAITAFWLAETCLRPRLSAQFIHEFANFARTKCDLITGTSERSRQRVGRWRGRICKRRLIGMAPRWQSPLGTCTVVNRAMTESGCRHTYAL
jgi:hypothetical protein